MTEEPVVLYDVSDHIATIRLNRPERGNAATFELGEQFKDAFRRVESDRDVRVVVLTGEGKHFCTGDDVEAAWGDPRMAETMRELGDARPPITPETTALLDCRVPTIAAVTGSALGIGMDLSN